MNVSGIHALDAILGRHAGDRRTPAVRSLDVVPAPVDCRTPWPSPPAWPKLAMRRWRPRQPAPRVLSIRLGGRNIKTFGFTFPEMPESVLPSDAVPSRTDAAPLSPGNRQPAQRQPGDATRRRTRIKPPADVVKLQDRMYYLLQPPLETLLGGSAMRFPFSPFPYQYDGIAFLYPRFAAILADEMGLGKTMQAITAIRLLLHGGEMNNVLLVCPKPLLTNWRREFSLWAPEIPTAIVEGDRTRRRWQWQLRDVPVKIANYELLLRDRDWVVGPDCHFDLMVLDEAQRIKNRASETAKTVRSVSRTRSWALTGTPVENSPDDLVSIFEFLVPGHLSSEMTPLRMGRAAGDYILRRTKDRVLADLPPKLYRDADLDLTPQQRTSYQMAEEKGLIRLTELGQSATIQHVFELVLRLKQICNFDPATDASAKMERLEADMEEVAASGQKAIIFSQWVGTLKQIGRRLARFKPVQYHGRVPAGKRDKVIERFRTDPDCHAILMSYGAGSVGLNLQFARYVFLFDRWWNPAVEDQAINRAHRIGVAGPVTITRFLTLDSIEERIDEVLCAKRELFDAILSQAASPKSSGITRDEIFGLFKLPVPQGRPDAA